MGNRGTEPEGGPGIDGMGGLGSSPVVPRDRGCGDGDGDGPAASSALFPHLFLHQLMGGSPAGRDISVQVQGHWAEDSGRIAGRRGEDEKTAGDPPLVLPGAWCRRDTNTNTVLYSYRNEEIDHLARDSAPSPSPSPPSPRAPRTLGLGTLTLDVGLDIRVPCPCAWAVS